MSTRCERLTLCAALAWVFAAASAAGAIPVTSGLRGYWPGEGTASDASGNGNHGTFVGESYAAGRIGQAFVFDGIGDRIVVPSSATLDATGPFSISAWVRRASTGSYHTIVDRGLGVSDPDSSYTLRLETTDVAIFDWEQGGTNSGITSTQTFTDGQWHHVAGVFDGAANRIYVDGELAGSSGTVFTPTVTEQSLQIGARLRSGPTYDLYFEGLIDEVAFYDRALTPGEIEQLAGVAVPSAGPGAWIGLSLLLALSARFAFRRGPRRPAAR